MRANSVNFSERTTSDILQSIRHIDHITYIASVEDEHRFLTKWNLLGFNEHMRLKTVRFPATHIALVSGISAEYPWATMTGLSVSEDPNSPINKFINLYGEGIQHTAYNIDPEADMEELHHQMEELGTSV
uniref:VOC domain-containing protein n=1 Tax=Tolypothrix bouteillei VB521301 TaxID=1479485 RepID=A0A0C1R1W1_9CYAN